MVATSVRWNSCDNFHTVKIVVINLCTVDISSGPVLVVTTPHTLSFLQESGVWEAGLRRELATQATEMTRLREALRECQENNPGGARKVRGHCLEIGAGRSCEEKRPHIWWG